MIQEKMYRYLGRNGTITSTIKLESIEPIEMISLIASQGKILTNGNKKAYSIVIFEEDLPNWIEIDDDS